MPRPKQVRKRSGKLQNTGSSEAIKSPQELLDSLTPCDRNFIKTKGDGHWWVKHIHRHRIATEEDLSKSLVYLVEWVDSPKKKDFTWEPEINLDGSQELVEAYRKEHPELEKFPNKIVEYVGADPGGDQGDFVLENMTTNTRI